jgi:hypothetical protein
MMAFGKLKVRLSKEVWLTAVLGYVWKKGTVSNEESGNFRYRA